MSFPHIDLECDKCGCTGSELQLRHPRVYQDQEREIHLRSQLGWCSDCEQIEAIEDLGNEEDIRNEIGNIREQQARSLKTMFGLFNWSNRPRQSDLENRLKTLNERIRIIESRKSGERCLKCGSEKVIPFGRHIDLPMDDNLLCYKGQKTIGFNHPGCGGEFVAIGSDIRFHIRPRYKYHYSLEGQRIGLTVC